MALKYGKAPATLDDRDIKLRSILSSNQLPVPPTRFGYGTIYKDWGMLGNDQYGDCVWAGIAHEVMGFTKLAGFPVNFSTNGVLSDYSAVTGFNRNDPNSDQGTNVRDAYKYWHGTGVVDSIGRRHKIGAYVSFTPGDYSELMTACYLFEFVGIGFQVQEAQEEQFNAGQPWDYVPGSPIIGGHYVVPTGRVSPADNGLLTWGKRQSFTQRFYENLCDEAWVAVTEEELKNGVNRRGLNLSQLNADLAALK